MSTEPEQATTYLFPGRFWQLSVIVTAAVGLVIAGYLYSTSLTNTKPLGCGEASGCGAVLSSRWSNLFGIPVSLPAAAVYLAVIATAVALPKVGIAKRKYVWWVLSFLGVTIFLSAIWFVGLQLLVIKQICPWCMTEHGVGLVCSLMLILPALEWVKRASQFEFPFGGGAFKSSALVGVLGVGALVGLQMAFETAGPEAERVDISGEVSGEGDQKTVSVLGNKYQLKMDEYPMLGSADSEHLIVVLFDYSCPHCQKTHGYLKHAMEKFPNQIRVMMLPMPLNSDCNENWKDDSPRFADSCKLAGLALSVWKTAPEHFENFDAWLFASQSPRTFEEATAYANELLGEKSAALADAKTWAESAIKQDVSLFAELGAARIPVLISPEFPAVVGRPGSQEELLEILRNEMGLGSDGTEVPAENENDSE